MAAEVVLTDDMSRYGLGRIHVLRAGAAPDVDAWAAEVETRGGEICEIFRWIEDGVDMHHLYLAWRLAMIRQPMYCCTVENGKFQEAVFRAAQGLYRRTGKVANRAVTRAEPGLPESVKVYEKEGADPVEIRVVQIEKGMQAGVVGVYHEEA